MKFWKNRNALILVYVIGNALTYRYLVKSDPSHAFEAVSLLKNLALSFIWPLYWLIVVI